MDISIQYKRGQYRLNSYGKVIRYAADYGEIQHTKGADGEPLDVYQGLFTHAERVFIINQYHHNGTFDEHKIMLNFYDEAQAKSAYETTTEMPVREIFPCTYTQFQWWLQYGNHRKPVSTQSFPYDSENPMIETHDWTNENQTAAQLIYAWRKTDPYGELTEVATLDSIMADEIDDGAEIQSAVFDALAVENKRLMRTAQALGRAFNHTSGSLKVVENGIQISAPMRKNGTTNIAVMYEMTDGQVVSVMFHNPDTTPQKITPNDMLVSWKWLLNRKDITIVVAKENGKDLPLQTVARRVMALVEKNTARFAKANANKAAETAELARLEAGKAQKLARLEELNQMIAQQEQARNSDIEPSSENPNDTVHFADDGGEYLLYGKKNTNDLEDLLFVVKNKEQFDLLLEKHLPDIKAQGFTQLHKRVYENGLGIPDFKGTLGKSSVGEDLSHLLQENPTNNPIELTENPSIELTGKEFGDFDVNTAEGKKALREAAFNELVSLTQTGQSVYCPALEADVFFSKSGADKFKRFSGDVRKIQIVAQIKQIIAQGQKFKPSSHSYQAGELANNTIYHYLKTPVKINQDLYGVRIVIREDNMGNYYWDLRVVEDIKAIFDGVNQFADASISLHKGDRPTSAKAETPLDSDNTAIFDNAQGKMVLNLFVTDKDGNSIDDDEDWIEEDLSIELTGKELGDFDVSTAEGKKALREAAFEHLLGLAKKGETVYCRALQADVGFNKSGAKKYKQFSGNPIKSQIAIQIQQIIANGVKFKESEADYTGEHMTYHYLKTNVRVASQEYGVRVVVREDDKGNFHYDLQVADSIDAIMDSIQKQTTNIYVDGLNTATYKHGAQQDANQVASDQPYLPDQEAENPFNFTDDKVSSVNKSDVPYRSQAETPLDSDNTAIFDNAQGKMVLNLFITDANGNPIDDEDLGDDWGEDDDVAESSPEIDKDTQEVQDPNHENKGKTIKIHDALDFLDREIFKGDHNKTIIYAVETTFNSGNHNKPLGYKILNSTQNSTIKRAQTQLAKAIRKNFDGHLIMKSTEFPKPSSYVAKEEQYIGLNHQAAFLLEVMGYTIDYADPENFTQGFEIGEAFIDKRHYVWELERFMDLNSGAIEPRLGLFNEHSGTLKDIGLAEMREKLSNGEFKKLRFDEVELAKAKWEMKTIAEYTYRNKLVLTVTANDLGHINIKNHDHYGGSNSAQDFNFADIQQYLVSMNHRVYHGKLKLSSGVDILNGEFPQMNEPEITNPDKQQAIDYLNKIINGEVDVMVDDFGEQFIAFLEKHEQDSSLRELMEQAVAVWQDAELDASADIE